MTPCGLKIVLDRPDRTYAIGETIRGVIEVDAHDDCECRKLTLHRGWRTQGKGNISYGGAEERVLFSGLWTAGERASYPFEFVAPPSPLTYHGHIVSVSWYLRAQADLAHARDQKAEEEFQLTPGETPDRGSPAPASYTPGAGIQFSMSAADAKKKGTLVYAIAIPVFLVALGASLGSIWLLFGKGIPQEWDWGKVFLPGFFALFFGIVAVTSAGFALAKLWYDLATRKLGPVEVALSPNPVRPGGTVGCKIHFQPQEPLELREAKVNWWGLEWARYTPTSTGSQTREFTHMLAEGHATASGPRSLMPGQNVVLEGTFGIPPDAPYTFLTDANKVHWWAEVKLSLKLWPDWSDKFELTVRP